MSNGVHTDEQAPRVIELTLPAPIPERWLRTDPPYEFTRDELLAIVRSAGFDISEHQLRSWVSYGVLPRPDRRLPAGATDGVARALYPRHVSHLLLYLLQDAKDGAQLAELKIKAAEYREILKGEDANPNPRSMPFANQPVTIRVNQTTGGLKVTDTIRWARGMRGLQRAVWKYAERLMERKNTVVKRATLLLENEDGSEIRIPVDLPPSKG